MSVIPECAKNHITVEDMLHLERKPFAQKIEHFSKEQKKLIFNARKMLRNRVRCLQKCADIVTQNAQNNIFLCRNVLNKAELTQKKKHNNCVNSTTILRRNYKD